MSTTGNIGLDALADAIATRVIERIQATAATATTPAPRLYDITQAAAYLGRTKAGMRRLVAIKRLLPVRIDDRIYFDRKDLDAVIDAAKNS